MQVRVTRHATKYDHGHRVALSPILIPCELGALGERTSSGEKSRGCKSESGESRGMSGGLVLEERGSLGPGALT